MIPRLRAVGVVGAGRMGAGIALTFARHELEVWLTDLFPEQLDRARESMVDLLEQGARRGMWDAEAIPATLARVHFTPRLEEVARPLLIIEAVHEEPEVKAELFGKLNRLASPQAVLASNTSSLSLADLSEMVEGPQRFLGLHFFYHPLKNRLLELVPGPETSPAVMELGRALGARTGRVVIETADRPGFCVNRFLFPWLNQAALLVAEGVANIPQVEITAREALRVPLGPFALMNLMGIPIVLHGSLGLSSRLGDFYAPAPNVEALHQAGQAWDLSGHPQGDGPEVARRLLGALAVPTGQLLDEGVCPPSLVEVGARVGLRWPQGPCAMVRRREPGEVADLAAQVLSPHQVAVPAWLRRAADDGAWPPLSRVHRGQREAWTRLALARPDRGNRVTPRLAADLARETQEAQAESPEGGLVLEALGPVFSLGAPVRPWEPVLAGHDHRPLAALCQAAQEATLALEGGPRPVVAWLNGPARGLGAELLLACRLILVGPQASFRLDQATQGLITLAGGGQRLVHRLGLGLARHLLFTAQELNAAQMVEVGLAAALVEPEGLNAALELWRPIVTRPAEAALPEGDWARLGALWQKHTHAEALLRGELPGPEEPWPQLRAELAGQWPPALAAQDRLLRLAMCRPGYQGLLAERQELDGLAAGLAQRLWTDPPGHTAA